jgi:hypothetical protein
VDVVDGVVGEEDPVHHFVVCDQNAVGWGFAEKFSAGEFLI